MKQVFEGWRGFIAEEEETTSANLGHNLSMLADSMVGGKILRTWPLNYARDMKSYFGPLRPEWLSKDKMTPEAERVIDKIKAYVTSDALSVYEDENVLAGVASQIPSFADTQFAKRAGQGAFGSVWVLGYPRQGQLLKIGIVRPDSASRARVDRTDHEKDFYKELYLKQQTGKASQQDLPVYEYVDIVPPYFKALRQTGEEIKALADELLNALGRPEVPEDSMELPPLPKAYVIINEIARQFLYNPHPPVLYAVEIGEVVMMKDKMNTLVRDTIPPKAGEPGRGFREWSDKEQADLDNIAKFFGEEIAEAYGNLRLYFEKELNKIWERGELRSLRAFKTYEDYNQYLENSGFEDQDGVKISLDGAIEDFVNKAVGATLQMIKFNYSPKISGETRGDGLWEIDGMNPRQYFAKNLANKYTKTYQKIYKNIMKEIFRLAKNLGDDFFYQNRTQDIHQGNFGYSSQTGKVVVFDP